MFVSHLVLTRIFERKIFVVEMLPASPPIPLSASPPVSHPVKFPFLVFNLIRKPIYNYNMASMKFV